MSFFGDSSNTDPFATNAGNAFNTFTPPQPPKKSRKGLLIALISVAGVLVLAGIFSGALFIFSNLNHHGAASSSVGEKANPNQVDTSSAGSSTGDPALDELNAAGSITWSPDSFSYIGNYPPLATYLSDQGTDGLSCALWLYSTKQDAVNAIFTGKDFTKDMANVTWGESGDGSFGYVLVGEVLGPRPECSTQAFSFLGVK